MNAGEAEPPDAKLRRVEHLVRTLSEVENELTELTGGQLDAVAGADGKTYLLSEAQKKLQASEATQRRTALQLAAILDALPAHIALIDKKGVIESVNERWRHCGCDNGLQGPGFDIGQNYLEICERVRGEGANDARTASVGIRRVLNGEAPNFEMEYPCHSATEHQWYRLMVTPVREDREIGAVVMHINITERRLAVQTLRTTIEEFRTLAESMPQIVWMARPDGSATYFNQHWMNYTGLTLHESLGDGWQRPFHPDDHQRARNAWREAVSNKRDYSVEARLRGADGKYRWWLIRSVPQIGAGGNILKWFGTCTDIHDLKLAELEVLQVNRSLTMLSACNEKLIAAEKEQELLDEICRIAVEIGGYRMAWVGFARDDEHSTIEPIAFAGSEEGFLGKLNLSWSAEAPTGRGPAGQTIRSGLPVVCEDFERDTSFSRSLHLKRQHGYRGLVCLPLRREGRAFGLLALYTARVQSISADEISLLEELADDLSFGLVHIRGLKETKEQAALLNAASDAIILRSIGNQILFWNRGAERVFGWKSNEVVGDNPLQIYVSDSEEFEKAMQEVLAYGKWAGEVRAHRKDGQEIVVDSHMTLMRDESGTPTSVLSIASDVTERKKLEAQVYRMQRMESIGTLAGGVAHDLNNALAPILMATGILRTEVTSDLGRQMLSAMETAAQHGADLVRQVLSFARGVEGKKAIVNVVHLMNDVREIIGETFPKNIDFIFNPSRNIWKILGDPTQLHQVFTNLCVNARDAMPKGGRLTVTINNEVIDEVYAGMHPDSRPGSYILVQVRDTGTGIPRDIRDRIFEPFFTTKEVGKGTGLGLSTTLAIVKSHGGFISLYSEMGSGTTFRIYLPASMTDVEADMAAPKNTGLALGNGELILVVDDEATIRLVAQKTLEKHGYRAIVASNGAESVALYAQYREQISVVLTDLNMPVMDGPATVVALKALNPRIKVIASSGMTTGEAGSSVPGVNYFIAKPYTTEALLNVLAQALSESE